MVHGEVMSMVVMKGDEGGGELKSNYRFQADGWGFAQIFSCNIKL